MTGDCHVRSREGLGVKFPRATRFVGGHFLTYESLFSRLNERRN